MLGEPWRTVAQFNPVFYLINGLRWCFTGSSDVPIGLSLACTLGFVALCIGRDRVHLPHRVALARLSG